ncbi:hypothetical protein RHMOL_Rhmol13G0276200 [Rhododendron molle]|uniref:Uncharacterized protein n=1 Tax=Rhododendron molle TaxID=49168 RepID=A0ACC0LCE5_RHOML|nr:hypothetical protein RHMOL_Rhmol13G0276200 [Rhododendron molle]
MEEDRVAEEMVMRENKNKKNKNKKKNRRENKKGFEDVVDNETEADEQSAPRTPSLIGEEGRLLLGKRSRTSPSSVDDNDEIKGAFGQISQSPNLEEKSPCLLVHSPNGPVLYSIQFPPANYPVISTSWRHKEGNFCQRCCVDFFGSGDDETQELGLRELTPAKSKSEWTPDCGVQVEVDSRL